MKAVSQYTLIIICSTFSFYSIAQNISNAKVYYSLILKEQAKVVHQNIDYISKSVHQHHAWQNEIARKQMLAQLDMSVNKVQSLPDFQGDSKLKETALEVFRHYKQTYQVVYKESEKYEVNNKTSYAILKHYFSVQNQAEKSLVKTGKVFINVQKRFAKKHKIHTSNQAIQCLFSQVAKVNMYSRDIYLAYAKVAEANERFMGFMKHKEGMHMEKHRKELLMLAKEAMETLSKIDHFGGNREYLDKSIELASYFKRIAGREYTELVAISNKVQASFDDANHFNKIVMDHHYHTKKLIQGFHQANTRLIHKAVGYEVSSEIAYKLSSNKKDESSLVQVDLREAQEKLVKKRFKKINSAVRERSLVLED